MGWLDRVRYAAGYGLGFARRLMQGAEASVPPPPEPRRLAIREDIEIVAPDGETRAGFVQAIFWDFGLRRWVLWVRPEDGGVWPETRGDYIELDATTGLSTSVEGWRVPGAPFIDMTSGIRRD